MIKLKNLINERKFGEPLPTLKSEMEKHQKLKERRGDTQKYSYKVIEPIKRDWVKQYRKMNERWMRKNMKKSTKRISSLAIINYNSLITLCRLIKFLLLRNLTQKIIFLLLVF